MIREKRNDAYGRQPLGVGCCGWNSYREAVSYIDSLYVIISIAENCRLASLILTCHWGIT